MFYHADFIEILLSAFNHYVFYIILYVHGYSVYNFTLYMSVWRASGEISY